jgi:prevent-host-death family protein
MKSIQKSEFKTRALELFRQVEGGESFLVTDRGKPVAMVTPIPDSSETLKSLIGSVEFYEGPLESVAPDDWDVLR